MEKEENELRPRFIMTMTKVMMVTVMTMTMMTMTMTMTMMMIHYGGGDDVMMATFVAFIDDIILPVV